jgi:hypothetical protein
MFKDMHERLGNIATEDSDREERLGFACPIRLDLFLAGGHELRDVCLVDGENSLDDETIDVCLLSERDKADAAPYSVAIAHIAMFRHTWPGEAEEQEAGRRAAARAAA